MSLLRRIFMQFSKYFNKRKNCYIKFIITFYYAVSTELNGVILAGCMSVRASVRPSVTKCHREQMTGPRSANFCTLVHVDEVSLQIFSECQRALPCP